MSVDAPQHDPRLDGGRAALIAQLDNLRGMKGILLSDEEIKSLINMMENEGMLNDFDLSVLAKLKAIAPE